MIITSTRTEAASNTSLKIYVANIERAENMKYLDVTIDQKLTFKHHLASVTKKMSSKTGFSGRLSKKLTSKTKLLIYNSIIQPHIDFCSTIIFMATEEEINDLQTMQNRVLRLILKKVYEPVLNGC
jgi:hypothetical protein